MDFEIGRIRSHSVENSLCKRLWACRKADLVIVIITNLVLSNRTAYILVTVYSLAVKILILRKVKLKFPLCLMKYNNIKTYQKRR